MKKTKSTVTYQPLDERKGCQQEACALEINKVLTTWRTPRCDSIYMTSQIGPTRVLPTKLRYAVAADVTQCRCESSSASITMVDRFLRGLRDGR